MVEMRILNTVMHKFHYQVVMSVYVTSAYDLTGLYIQQK